MSRNAGNCFRPATPYQGCCRKILVLYRQVRRRRAVGLCRGVFRRRTCDTGIWTKPLALAADAGYAMGFQSIFAWEALPEAGFSKKVVIDGHRFSPGSLVHDSAHPNLRPDHSSSSQSLESPMRLASGTRKRPPRQRLRPNRDYAHNGSRSRLSHRKSYKRPQTAPKTGIDLTRAECIGFGALHVRASTKAGVLPGKEAAPAFGVF